MSSSTASSLHEISHFELNLGGDQRSLKEAIIEIFNRQHRLFIFMILFVEDKALLHFDRAGVSMAHEFDYAHRPEVTASIGKFLYRLSRNRTAMGHDPTATRANKADTELFRNLHMCYHAASAVGRGLRDAAIDIDGWPIYKLCVEGRFSLDGSTTVLPDAPVSRRESLVGRPMSTWVSPSVGLGHGTRTHVAYDLAGDQVVVIKDSW